MIFPKGNFLLSMKLLRILILFIWNVILLWVSLVLFILMIQINSQSPILSFELISFNKTCFIIIKINHYNIIYFKTNIIVCGYFKVIHLKMITKLNLFGIFYFSIHLGGREIDYNSDISLFFYFLRFFILSFKNSIFPGTFLQLVKYWMRFLYIWSEFCHW